MNDKKIRAENIQAQQEEFLQLAKAGSLSKLNANFSSMNPVDIALSIENLIEELEDIKKITAIFRTLPKELAAEVFAEFSSESQQMIIESITDSELAGIVEELFIDDAVDMLEELPASVVKRVMKNAKPDTRKLINQFLKYPDSSAGSIMTAEYTELRKTMTIGEALQHIRRTGEDRETIYTCYVIDSKRFLEGIVTVKDLLLNNDNELISDIMATDLISVTTTEDQEEAAKLFAKYSLLSIPVTDQENRLVGIVTVDDAVDVLRQEATEDFEKMAAMSPSEKPYLKTNVFTLAKRRIVWLLVLMISGMITGGILGRYEAAFATVPLLVTFIPMLTDTGGNAGSQSSTLVIRGMAVSEITTSDLLAVFWKELRVSFLVGIVLAAVNFLRLIITYPGNVLLALTVAIALFCTVIIAKAVGGVLPIIAKKCHADPAIMAAPLITTIVDAFSLVIYFTIAEAMLGI